MIRFEHTEIMNIENAIRGMELELLKYLFNHYQDKGYHKNKYGYELHSKPYITVKTEVDAILELSYRKISKIKKCCKNNNLKLNDSVLYKGILVFPTGQFISIRNCKIIKQQLNRDKYLWTNTGNNKKEQSHRVIAKCFIPNQNNLPCVNHKNGIKNDNRVENLEWCTYSNNTLHSFQNGLQKNIGNQYGRFKVKKYDKI